MLVEELAAHSPQLVELPRVVALNKTDLPGSGQLAAPLAASLGVEVFPVSGVTGAGIEALLHRIADAVQLAERAAPESRGFVLHRPLRNGFSIERRNDRWVVAGRLAERAVAVDDLTLPEAADYVAGRLARLGVDEALRQAGAVDGDEIQIGDLVFEFRDEEGS